MIELYYLTGRWRRHSAEDLACLFGSNAGVAPIPIEIDSVGQLRQVLCPERVTADGEASEIELEIVLNALAINGFYLTPDRSVFLLDRGYRGGGPDDGERAAIEKAA
jgi:hypothetical protein